MKKLLVTAACAAALTMVPMAGGGDIAHADHKFLKGLIGGIIIGAIIHEAVRAGQSHCHEGIGCHSHGYAGPYHYHQFYGGPIVYYQQPVYQTAPVIVVPGGGYSQAHYAWCAGKYASYHAPSNTWQPYGPYPRRQCISPYL